MDNKGFFEDPATGSANGNLACYLLEHNFFSMHFELPLSQAELNAVNPY